MIITIDIGFHFSHHQFRSRDIAIRLWAGQPGFDSQQGQEIFPFSIAFRPALGPTQPRIRWVPGALSLGVKRQGRDSDHSHPSSAEVHKIPARLQCTVQVCELACRTCTTHHTVAGRSSVSLTQSPFAFPSNCRCGPPLTSYMSGRAVPSRARHSSTHHRTLCSVHGLCTSDLVPRPRNVKLYLHSPIRLYGVVLHYIIKYRDNFTLLYFYPPLPLIHSSGRQLQ
jgi:hypothetical protein